MAGKHLNKWQFLAVGALAACGASAQPDASDLLELSIEELANLRMTSASRIAENLHDDTHPEFEAGIGNLVERSACLKRDWSF